MDTLEKQVNTLATIAFLANLDEAALWLIDNFHDRRSDYVKPGSAEPKLVDWTRSTYFEEYKDHDIIKFEDVNGRQPFIVFPSGAQNSVSRHASVKAAKRSIDKIGLKP